MKRSPMTALIFIAAALLVPATLPAQFTTYVGQPRKAAADTVKPVAAVAKARADSVARMSLTDMKAWVDSAAGTSKPVASADTLASPTAAAPVAANANNSPRTTTNFSNGAIAPNTATALPTLLMMGFVSLGAGLVLFRLRRRRS